MKPPFFTEEDAVVGIDPETAHAWRVESGQYISLTNANAKIGPLIKELEDLRSAQAPLLEEIKRLLAEVDRLKLKVIRHRDGAFEGFMRIALLEAILTDAEHALNRLRPPNAVRWEDNHEWFEEVHDKARAALGEKE